jgi:hypothetical protein
MMPRRPHFASLATISAAIVFCQFANASSLRAQSSVAPAPSYEVTSVKIDANGDPNHPVRYNETPDGLRATNVIL